MMVMPAADSKPSLVAITFEFPALTRMLKMKVNTKNTTLKSLRLILA